MKLLQHLGQMLWGRGAPSHDGPAGSNRRHNPSAWFARRPFRRPAGRQRRLSTPRLQHGHTLAFHGTPSVTNTQSILRHGFMTGHGNGLADGLYFSRNPATAKSYAGAAGVLLRCIIRLGKTCVWSPQMQQRFSGWCQARSIAPDNSAKTAWLLRHGFNTLQDGDVIVVLAPQFANPAAWKRKDRRIRVLSVHRAADDRRLHV
jgi:hypothetical protein